MAVAARSKNPLVGQATALSGGKILILTDMRRQGLRLEVM